MRRYRTPICNIKLGRSADCNHNMDSQILNRWGNDATGREDGNLQSRCSPCVRDDFNPPQRDRVLLRAELMSAYHFRLNVDVSCLMGPALEAHHYTAKPRQEVALLGYIN
jgi:hypothetical protein